MDAAHIPDAELAMALDGELDPGRAAEVEEHLSHCWACRARRSEFEGAMARYVAAAAQAESDDPKAVPPAQGPTAQLRARLRQLAEEQTQPRPTTARARGLLAAAGLALMMALLPALGFLIWRHAGEPPGPLPNARLTPGAVRLVSRDAVCRLNPEDEGRLVPADLAARVFAGYRIARPQPRAYEVDYLISPALGGATALENLWPVPYAEGVWTSRVKDALEDRLRSLVCAGHVDLETAQRELARNWIAAYRKYFRTQDPVAAHAHFVKDSPWE